MQLTRLPNVFTAAADVAAGFLLTHAALQPAGEFVALLIASVCLYSAGMVMNDLFDYEIDVSLRPQRPLPSGRIARGQASAAAVALILVAIAAAATAGGRAVVVGVLLLAAIVLYDGLLKATWAGPVVMGLCRLLNVALGASTAATHLPPVAAMWPVFPLAAGMGVYIAGVTWFARREALRSHRPALIAAVVVINLGFALVGLQAAWPNGDFVEAFWVVLAVAVVLVNRHMIEAVIDPSPGPVQAAIKIALLAIIVFDAAAVLLVRGPLWSLAVLALLLPAIVMGRWVYST
jgi:4-hydroxybenzoate polyprenyltransferase